MIRTTVNTRHAIQGLERHIRQIPFARSLALNNLANQFQRVQQEYTLRAFTVRRQSFILNTIKRLPGRDFATKTIPRAAVRIDPQRDFLAKHEAGGEKAARVGHAFVALPSREIKRTKAGVIPRRFYPSKFRPFVDTPTGAKGQERAFIVRSKKSGDPVLLQRIGKGKGRLRILAYYKPSVHLNPMLHFHQNAIEVAKSAWPSTFAAAWKRAVGTAR